MHEEEVRPDESFLEEEETEPFVPTTEGETDNPDEVPSAEPVEITLEEAAALGVTATKEPEVPHLSSLVCDVCLELNLTTKSCIECLGCGKAFCYHFSSSVDTNYFVNCMSDVSVTKQVIYKTYEHTNEAGETKMYRRKAREIKIGGLSWLFAQRKIIELSDVELDMMIEFHRSLCVLMLDESERRRNERMHRYANVKVHIPTPSTTSVTSDKTTTVKKTRTVSKDKASEQLAALLSSMKAKGLNIDALAKMLTEKK